MWPQPQETAVLVKFTEEILNGNLYFLCSVCLTVIERLQQNFISWKLLQKKEEI